MRKGHANVCSGTHISKGSYSILDCNTAHSDNINGIPGRHKIMSIYCDILLVRTPFLYHELVENPLCRDTSLWQCFPQLIMCTCGIKWEYILDKATITLRNLYFVYHQLICLCYYSMEVVPFKSLRMYNFHLLLDLCYILVNGTSVQETASFEKWIPSPSYITPMGIFYWLDWT